MSDNAMDIVSVAHRDDNWADMMATFRVAMSFHPQSLKVIPVDNRVDNRGFAKGCNYGASLGDAPIIGFLNPDVMILGPFLEQVHAALLPENMVITGERFAKPDHELRVWGCSDWVCGATFFVKRDWFEENGGFHEGFVWGWEETDLIRRAQSQGRGVRSIPLPIHHASPDVETPEDADYKRLHFEDGARLFRQRWGTR